MESLFNRSYKKKQKELQKAQGQNVDGGKDVSAGL
jgi:hypothetical protein